MPNRTNCNKETNDVAGLPGMMLMLPGMSSLLEQELLIEWSSTGEPWDRSAPASCSSPSSSSPSSDELSRWLTSNQRTITCVISGSPCVAWPVPRGFHWAAKLPLPLTFWEFLQVMMLVAMLVMMLVVMLGVVMVMVMLMKRLWGGLCISHFESFYNWVVRNHVM